MLLARRPDNGVWNLPGGGVELGESPWDAVVREVREETGLSVEVERLAGVYAKPERADVVFSFCCRVVGGQPTLTEEADAIDAFPVDALPARTVPRHVERIRDGLAATAQALLKEQPGPSTQALVDHGVL